MSKFVIECPHCGNFAEAEKGFFARKKIHCSCGHVINVRTEKMNGRKCSHCGNTVVFDQSKGEKAVCPVCHKPINTVSEISQAVEFACGQCGISLTAPKPSDNGENETCVCPVCDYANNVRARLQQKKIKESGLASVIKYEGNADTIVWKHPVEDFNMGSQLIVHESQEAVFFKDGQALDIFGSGRYTLETQQLPLLEKLYKLPTDTESTFHSEVYFVNMATQMGIKWGTDMPVRFFDPFTGMHIEIGASGECNIRVSNSKKLLLKIVGTTEKIGQQQLFGEGNKRGIFRAMIMTQVKSCLARSIKESKINVLEIDENLKYLSEVVKSKIAPELEEYGFAIPEFYIQRVVYDENTETVRKQYSREFISVREENIRKKQAEAAAERMAVEAQTKAKMKIIGAQGEAEALKIAKAAEAEAYKMQAKAEAEEMKMKGYTYQQETARQVGLEAMQNGLTGGASAGGLGDLAGLGISLGAIGGVMGMTRDALNPIADTSKEMGQTFGNIMSGSDPDTWDCPCGNKGITGKFCSECGTKRPEKTTWDCPCGNKGITGKFCSECGAKRPEKTTWECPCGNKGITGKFCNECGTKRPEKTTWDCTCGNKNIKGKFCDECGKSRDDQ